MHIQILSPFFDGEGSTNSALDAIREKEGRHVFADTPGNPQ